MAGFGLYAAGAHVVKKNLDPRSAHHPGSLASKVRLAGGLATASAAGAAIADWSNEDSESYNTTLNLALAVGAAAAMAGSYTQKATGEMSPRAVMSFDKASGGDGSLISGVRKMAAKNEAKPFIPIIPMVSAIRQMTSGGKEFADKVAHVSMRQDAYSTSMKNKVDDVMRDAPMYADTDQIHEAKGKRGEIEGYKNTLMYRRAFGLPITNEWEKRLNDTITQIVNKLGDDAWEVGIGPTREVGEMTIKGTNGTPVKTTIKDMKGKSVKIEGKIVGDVIKGQPLIVETPDGNRVTVEVGTKFKHKPIVNTKTYVPRRLNPEFNRIINHILIKGDDHIDLIRKIADGVEEPTSEISRGLAIATMQALNMAIKTGEAKTYAKAAELWAEKSGQGMIIEDDWMSSAIAKARTAKDLEGPAFIYDWSMDWIYDHIDKTTANIELAREFGSSLSGLHRRMLESNSEMIKDFWDKAIKSSVGIDITKAHDQKISSILSGVADVATTLKIALNVSTMISQIGVTAISAHGIGPMRLGQGAMKYIGSIVKGMFKGALDVGDALSDKGVRDKVIAMLKEGNVSGAIKMSTKGSKNSMLEATRTLRDSGAYGSIVNSIYNTKVMKGAVGKALVSPVLIPDKILRGSTMLGAHSVAVAAVTHCASNKKLSASTRWFLKNALNFTDEDIKTMKNLGPEKALEHFKDEIERRAYKYGSDLNGNPERANMPIIYHESPYIRMATRLTTFTYVATHQFAKRIGKIKDHLSKGEYHDAKAAAVDIVTLAAYMAGAGYAVNEIKDQAIDWINETFGDTFNIQKGRDMDLTPLQNMVYTSLASGNAGYIGYVLEKGVGLTEKGQDTLRSISAPPVLGSMQTLSRNIGSNSPRMADEMIGRGSLLRVGKIGERMLESGRKRRTSNKLNLFKGKLKSGLKPL